MNNRIYYFKGDDKAALPCRNPNHVEYVATPADENGRKLPTLTRSRRHYRTPTGESPGVPWCACCQLGPYTPPATIERAPFIQLSITNGSVASPEQRAADAAKYHANRHHSDAFKTQAVNDWNALRKKLGYNPSNGTDTRRLRAWAEKLGIPVIGIITQPNK